ncbi:MAG TPA: hypothetical protein VFE84_01210 [Patescibacteria group bacterium]|nr:hypothetical protein [Patescibacteria group bacterium]
MKTFLKIAIGCLVAPIVIGVVLIIVALTLRKTSPPQHREEAANLEQSVAGVTEAQLASEGLEPGKAAPMGRPLPVGIVLEEGNFTIEAGPAGSSIRVEGDYDAGAYELKQELAKDGSGQPHYTLSFRSRRSMFHRLLTEGGVHIDKNDNRISIFLPRGIPIALDARIRIGTSHLNLGGLALSNASLDLSMGEHTITVAELNPLEMSNLTMNLAMGEWRLGDIGNLRAGNIEMWGKMGTAHFDFGEKLARDTRLTARMRMGELDLHVPPDARVKASTSAFLGDSSGKLPADENANGFLLEVDSSIKLGEVKYRRN